LADLDERFDARLAEQIQGVRKDAASLTTDLAAATARAEAAAHQADAASALARTLKRAQDRTAHTVTTQTADINAMQQALATLSTDMTARNTSVLSEVSRVASGLTDARNDVADNRRQIAALKTEVGEQIAGNTRAVAELRRLGEQQQFEVDVLKSSRPESPKVADVRIQLTKADVRKARYDVILHFDDRQIERKDLTLGEPVQFLVGPERRRYELVVTDVERDRIRGYLSVSNAGAIGARLAVR
jgi:chromosome segregation ATPase